MIIIFILHSNCKLTLNDIHTGFLGNYIIVSACAKVFKFLIVFMFCIVVYTTEEDHRSVVETFGVNKSLFVNLGASVKHN